MSRDAGKFRRVQEVRTKVCLDGAPSPRRCRDRIDLPHPEGFSSFSHLAALYLLRVLSECAFVGKPCGIEKRSAARLDDIFEVDS